MNRLFILLTLLASLPLQSFTAQAASQWQSHAAIRDTAQTFLDAFAANQHQGRSEVRLGALDPRLRLKTCSLPLEATMPAGGRAMGNTTVAVRCPDEAGWNIYLSARINVFGPVLVARQPLIRGATIQASDVEPVERNLASLPYGYYADPEKVSGMIAKRAITAASVITPQMLSAPKLVKRGERVSLIAESGPLKLRMIGKALNDGTSGQLIQVRAEGSNRVVDGIVVSQGVVKVTL